MLPLRLISPILRFWKHSEVCAQYFLTHLTSFSKSLGMLILAYLHRKLGGIPCLAKEMQIGNHKAAFQPQADYRTLDCRTRVCSTR